MSNKFSIESITPTKLAQEPVKYVVHKDDNGSSVIGTINPIHQHDRLILRNLLSSTNKNINLSFLGYGISINSVAWSNAPNNANSGDISFTISEPINGIDYDLGTYIFNATNETSGIFYFNNLSLGANGKIEIDTAFDIDVLVVDCEPVISNPIIIP